jgi:hypothetical protein
MHSRENIKNIFLPGTGRGVSILPCLLPGVNHVKSNGPETSITNFGKQFNTSIVVL